MKQAFFRCDPWDLEDEGIEPAIARMAGELGIDAVSVEAATHRVRAFRARPFDGARTIRRRATTHFQPSAAAYVNTRLRPTAAAWMKSRNPLAHIARAAERHSVKLRARLVCCHNEVLAERHAIAGCVDVFGDPIEAWLCPSNPEVREFVAAMAEDLTTNYPLTAIELASTDFGWAGHVVRHRQIGWPLEGVAGALLGWCFCSACRQRAADAGVDVEAVRRTVLETVERAARLDTPAAVTFESLAAEHPALAAYHRMRVETVTSLVGLVRARVKTRLVVEPPTGLQQAGADPAVLASNCDALLLPFDHDRAEHGADEDAAGEWRSAERIELDMPCYPPHVPDGPALVERVHRASQAGHAAIGFGNYGIAPEPCLNWVRQAIRYARRESGSPT